MRYRVTTFHLAVVLVGLGAVPVQAQGTCGPGGLQQFLCRLVPGRGGCECQAAAVEARIAGKSAGWEQKAAPVFKSPPLPKPVPVTNVAVMQRGPLVLKPAPVPKLVSQKGEVPQKASVSQKGSVDEPCGVLDRLRLPWFGDPSHGEAPEAACGMLDRLRRSRLGEPCCGGAVDAPCGVLDRLRGHGPLGCRLGGHCEPCGYCYPSRVGSFIQRLDTALLRVFPRPASCCHVPQESCGCGAGPGGDMPLLPVPEPWDPPLLDDNPFRDDTLPIPPAPPPPAREARLPLHPPANRIAVEVPSGEVHPPASRIAVEVPSGEVRPAAFYTQPVQVETAR